MIGNQFTRHFFVGTRLIASIPQGLVPVAGSTLRAPRSCSYVCPVCGDLWARSPIERDWKSASQPYPDLWNILSHPCRKHTDPFGSRVPGSLILDPSNKEFAGCLTGDLLRYEFEVHLLWAERLAKNYQSWKELT